MDLPSVSYPNNTFLKTVVFIVNLIEFSGACTGELYESALCRILNRIESKMLDFQECQMAIRTLLQLKETNLAKFIYYKYIHIY